jgi:hypothetical protein
MSSKRIALIFLLLLTACGDFLSGKQSKPQAIEMSDSRFTCLKEFPKTLSSLSDANGNKEDVQKSFGCIEDALLYFEEHTTGSFANAYSGEDFRKFFGKYFLKENNITPSLMNELMVLKAALVGGRSDVVTKDEVIKLSKVLGVVKEEIIRLLPYQKVLLFKAEQADSRTIDDLGATLTVSAKRILKETEFYKSEYTFIDAKRLVDQGLEFIKTQNSKSDLADINKKWPLLMAVKDVILGKDLSIVGNNDWNHAIDSVVSLYDLLLRGKYLVTKFDLEDSDQLRQLGEVIKKALACIEKTYQMYKNQSIPTAQVDILIRELFNNNLVTNKKIIESKITPDIISTTYKNFIGRLGDGRSYAGTMDLDAIKLEHINRIEDEFYVWRSIQNWVDSVASNSKDDLEWKKVIASLNSYDFAKSARTQLPELGYTKRDRLLESWNDFKSLIIRDRPVLFSRAGQYVVLPKMMNVKTTWGSLSRNNLVHALTRMFLLGYAQREPQLSKMYLVEDDLVQWFSDFKEFGQRLKAFAPDISNSGKRGFLEVNFFTFSGDGNKKANFNEMYEFVSMLVSVGLKTIDEFRSHMVQCETNKLGIFEMPVYKEECFKREVPDTFVSTFRALPGFVNFILTLPKEGRDQFFNVFINATRNSNPATGEIDHDDVRNFVMLTHYLESVFVTYDVNHDDLLDQEELLKASDRFVEFFRERKEKEFPKMTPDTVKDWALHNGFVFLVLEGREPGPMDLLSYGAGNLANSVLKPAYRTTKKADRLAVAKVLKVLKDKIKEEQELSRRAKEELLKRQQ